MHIASGTTLGSYEITSLLGKGGFGEVYRARDTKLKRDVAIKILPDEFSSDHDRITRFQREAEVCASLNHPNIAAIYDVQQTEATRFLVLEYVEGATLADLIRQRGALPIDDAIHIAKQIAEALEAAHEKGIIHRDLKPANIKITSDGKVKVLDFGLAKSVDTPLRGVDQPNSPTLASIAATEAGMILGTVSYMSPEQAKGAAIDKRSDIWAFGAVLYEMLSGRQAFTGDTASETLARVLERDPDFSALPPSVARIRKLLEVCLEKDRRKRLRDIGDVFLFLDGTSFVAASATAASSRYRRVFVFVSSLVVIAAISAVYVALTRSNRDGINPVSMRFTIQPPSGTLFGTEPYPALSPDGQYLAFIAASPGRGESLWLRKIESLEPQILAGTEGALYPFWSPDSREIGFFAQGKLKRIAIAGGSPQTICDSLIPLGGTWNDSGVILFSARGGLETVIHQVPATGGKPTPVTQLDAERKESEQRFPYFLPDGRRFLYLGMVSTQIASGVYVGSLDSKDSTWIMAADSNVAYAPPGYILFVHERALMAKRFDVANSHVEGSSLRLVDSIESYGIGNLAPFTASNDGLLVYGGNRNSVLRELVWIDRSGRELGKIETPDRFLHPSISPDEKRLAVTITQEQTGTDDVWIFDLVRSTKSRLTSHPLRDFLPVWAPDSQEVLFGSNRNGPEDLIRRRSDGTGAETAVLETLQAHKHPTDWFSGKQLLYDVIDPQTSFDLWTVDTADPKSATPLFKTAFNEVNGHFSPDGRWIAYTSDESGTPQIYVVGFGKNSGRLQVSPHGGVQPMWRSDGKELYYIAADQKLMVVSVNTSGVVFEAGIPAPLFQTSLSVGPLSYPEYVVASLGQRFLLSRPIQPALSSPMIALLNWTAILSK